jgi:hypothetical protein
MPVFAGSTTIDIGAARARPLQRLVRRPVAELPKAMLPLVLGDIVLHRVSSSGVGCNAGFGVNDDGRIPEEPTGVVTCFEEASGLVEEHPAPRLLNRRAINDNGHVAVQKLRLSDHRLN